MPSILETVGPRSGSAPLTYTLSEQGTVDVMSIFAEFNGTGAGGTFRPVVTVRSQSGAILARCFPSDTVAAGDSADVTFATFLRDGGTSGGTLETTDGSTTVDPTATLEIGYGITLTNPSAGVAHIAIGSTAVDYPTVVSTITDLVAYWPMDDPQGNQSDDSGYAPVKDLVRAAGSTVASYQVAAPEAVVATGDTGGAVQFNYNQSTANTSRANGDTFSAADTNPTPKWAFAGVLPMSVSCWVKIASGWSIPAAADPVGLVTTHAPTGSGLVPGWGLFVYPPSSPFGNLVPYAHRGSAGADSNVFAPTYAQLTPDEWFQVGYSYDGTRMFLWVNGIPINSAASSVSIAGEQTIKVGSGDWNNSTQLLFGTIARVAVFKRALTSSEWLRLAVVA